LIGKHESIMNKDLLKFSQDYLLKNRQPEEEIKRNYLVELLANAIKAWVADEAKKRFENERLGKDWFAGLEDLEKQ